MIARVELLEELGPALGRRTVDSIHQSRHPNMKEPRSQGGVRILFAFVPRRTAILLIRATRARPTRRLPVGISGMRISFLWSMTYTTPISTSYMRKACSDAPDSQVFGSA